MPNARWPRGSCVRLALSTGQNSLGCIRIKTLRIVPGTWNIYPKQPTFLLNFGRTPTLPAVVRTHPIQIAISNLDHTQVLIPQSLHWSEYINSFQSLLWKLLKRNTIQLSNRTFKEFSLESKAHLLQAAVARIEDAYLRSVRFIEALQLAPCSWPSNIYCQYQQKHHLVHPVRCPGTFAKCLTASMILGIGHPGSLSNNHGVDGFFTIQLGQQAMLAPLFLSPKVQFRRVKIVKIHRLSKCLVKHHFSHPVHIRFWCPNCRVCPQTESCGRWLNTACQVSIVGSCNNSTDICHQVPSGSCIPKVVL